MHQQHWATAVGMGWSPKKRHMLGRNVLNCDMKVKRYFAFCGSKYVALWSVGRSCYGGDVGLDCIRRHKCAAKGKLGKGLDPIGLEIGASRKVPPKLADKKGREGPLGWGAEGLLGNSSLLRSEKLISY